MGYNLRYIFNKGSTSSRGTPSSSNGHKPQTLPSSALAKYDWFLEHVFLAPYYFMSDRAWDLFCFVRERREKSRAESQADKPSPSSDLGELVSETEIVQK